MPKRTRTHADEHEVELTRLDRVLWPDDGITKEALIDYYRGVAPVMLPHLRERPVTLRAFPGGIEKTGYYRREAPESAPAWLRRTSYTPASGGQPIDLPLIDDTAGLLWFVNAGAIECHHWLSRVGSLDRPDFAVLDLDPGAEADFTAVIEVALTARSALDQLGIAAFPKTSGGRGLHLYLPLDPGPSFEEVRGWIKALADELAAQHPDLISAAGGTTHEGNLVTIDYAQNSIGRNTAAPYTVRARPGAPVSMPLRWEEIAGRAVRAENFTIRTAPGRIDEFGDLFADVLKGGQTLPSV